MNKKLKVVLGFGAAFYVIAFLGNWAITSLDDVEENARLFLMNQSVISEQFGSALSPELKKRRFVGTGPSSYRTYWYEVEAGGEVLSIRVTATDEDQDGEFNFKAEVEN